jgi:hypothetical protein
MTARMTRTREQLYTFAMVAASREPVIAFGRATSDSHSSFQIASNSRIGSSLIG